MTLVCKSGLSFLFCLIFNSDLQPIFDLVRSGERQVSPVLSSARGFVAVEQLLDNRNSFIGVYSINLIKNSICREGTVFYGQGRASGFELGGS